MKKLSILLSLFFFCSISFAQQANKLLNEVSGKVKSYENIAIEFKYIIHSSTENLNREARGNMTLQGDKYILNMMGTTRIFDGKNIITIVPEDEEVTISAFNPKEDEAVTPSSMLSFYEKGYRAEMDIVQNVKGRKIQYVKLKPTRAGSEIKEILLGIDTQTKHIYKMIQTDSNGSQSTVTITSFKTNQPLSKTLFSFDENRYKKEGYYINRL